MYPAEPQQDDTIKIQARIHNYGLVDTDKPVSVSFYRGDPDEGGTILTSIYGETKFSTPYFIQSRGEAYVEMDWQIPADINDYTRNMMLLK